ncbi:hypothetical protein [Helicobacter sp. T3_23-1059]
MITILYASLMLSMIRNQPPSHLRKGEGNTLSLPRGFCIKSAWQYISKKHTFDKSNKIDCHDSSLFYKSLKSRNDNKICHTEA